jgi:hypothetical protein
MTEADGPFDCAEARQWNFCRAGFPLGHGCAGGMAALAGVPLANPRDSG